MFLCYLVVNPGGSGAALGGRIDILVNNGGKQVAQESIEDITDEQLEADPYKPPFYHPGEGDEHERGLPVGREGEQLRRHGSQRSRSRLAIFSTSSRASSSSSVSFSGVDIRSARH